MIIMKYPGLERHTLPFACVAAIDLFAVTAKCAKGDILLSSTNMHSKDCAVACMSFFSQAVTEVLNIRCMICCVSLVDMVNLNIQET